MKALEAMHSGIGSAWAVRLGKKKTGWVLWLGFVLWFSV